MNSWNNQGRTGTTLRVLMQNRPNAFTQRGGDTVLMEKTAEELCRLGCEVSMDAGGLQDPRQFDIVHIFNFAIPEFTRQLAQRAHSLGVPFVVTTLYEDYRNFHNKSVTLADALIRYVQNGQQSAWWAQNRVDLSKVQNAGNFDNAWTAAHAAMLLSSGAEETKLLRNDYPSARIVETKFGHEVGATGSAETFVKKYGVSDFIFCVGRIESRKNQLMLLKALEDSTIPLVLAGGGFTYQPSYAQAVRDFRRAGRTVILDKISSEMLACAYAAARVHCLPSWYELPGLVSLEAASHGCSVVASECGSIRDYLGDKIFYCDPSSESSIKNAVLAAYYSPKTAGLREAAQACTWAETGRETLKAYQTALGRQNTQPLASFETARIQPATSMTIPTASASSDQIGVLERGEEAARHKDFALAEELLSEALRLDPRSVRALKGLGAVWLAQGDVQRAKTNFACALQIDPNEPRSLSGMGMCLMMEKDPNQAYTYFVNALRLSPDHLVTLLQLIECSYNLNRFDDLERVLADYVARNPQDLEMTFCHAGSLFKLGQLERAATLNEKVLSSNPSHLGGRQLRDLISEARKKEASSGPATLSSEIKVEKTATLASAPDFTDRKLLELEDAKRERNLDKVREGCREILSRSTVRPDQTEKAQVLSAEVCVLSGELQQAAEMYDQILGGNPNCARAICGKGALSANSGDWTTAKEWFQKALTIQPGFDVALAGLGLCASWARDLETAWKCYLEALETNPENQRALLGVIELGYHFKRFEPVERVLKNYLDMHPADLNFLYSLAGCYYAQGRVEEAMSEISKITIFEPQHEKALELREMINSGRASTSCASL